LAGAGMVTGFSRLVTSRRLSALPSTSRRNATPAAPFVAICGVVLLALVFLTWQQTAIYHNIVTLYTATLAKNPGCWMAHYNLATAQNDQGKTDEPIPLYRQVIDLRPSYAEAH